MSVLVQQMQHSDLPADLQAELKEAMAKNIVQVCSSHLETMAWSFFIAENVDLVAVAIAHFLSAAHCRVVACCVEHRHAG